MTSLSLNATPPGPIYRCRSSILEPEVTWRLADDALERDDAPYKRIPYADIHRISLFGTPGLIMQGNTVARPSGVCRIRAGHGRRANLCSNHFLGFGRFEDRSETFQPFVAALVRRAVAANPGIVLRVGLPVGIWITWLFILILVVLAFAAAFGGFVFASKTMVAALWSGDHHAIGFDTVFDALLMLVAAFSCGVAVPGIVRLLKRERPRTIENPGRTDWLRG